ncbi:MAG: CHC2 zinc finger domain-containing protein [Negativicutes bacterium]|nr:CHC2 zinc finger domain-containing protein [Negativicutes bacterium]
MPKKPFVDFRDIRSRITMEQVLEHYGVLHTFKRAGDRLSGPCPIHGGSNPSQFRVDTEKNVWNCFSECKHGGNVLDFIARKESISIHDAAIKACEWFNIPLEEVKTNPQSAPDAEDHAPLDPKATSAPVAPVKPNGSHPGDDGSPQGPPNPPLKFKLEKLNRSHPYFEERGITLETVIDFGLGFFTGDKGLMVGRIVIPINNVNGELVAYAGRWPGTPLNADTSKYKLPTGFRKGQELFNLDRAVKEPADKPMIIVEGFFDAVKLHQNGWHKVVALMGSTMTAAQEELIHQHTNSCSHVVVMLDEDDAGRAGREDVAARLSKLCYVKIHVFDRPDMQPEHLTAEDVKQLFQ